MRAKLTKELGVCAAAIVVGGAIVIGGGGRDLTVGVPPIPPTEDAVPVSGREVPVQLPPLAREMPSGGGRDPFRKAGIWEEARPEPLGPPPAWPAGRMVPILSIAGGRALALAAPRLPIGAAPTSTPAGTDDSAEEQSGSVPTQSGEDGGEDAGAYDGHRARGRLASSATSTPSAATSTARTPGLDDPLPDPDAAGFRQYDLLYLHARPEEPIEGTLLEETEESYVFRRRGRPAAIPYDRALVIRVDRADRPEDYVKRESARLRAGDTAGHLRLARFALRYERWELARAEGLLAAATAPKETEGYRVAAQAARARYAAVAPPFHPDLREKELEVYERARAAGVKSAALQLLEARALQEDGAREAAADVLRRALVMLRADTPSSTAAAAASSATDASSTVSSTTATASSTDAAPAWAERWIEAGDLALGLGLYPDAVEAYGRTTSTPALAARAFTGLALSRFALGELPLARAALARVEEIAPELAEPVLLLGELDLFAGDAQEARKRFALAKERGDQGVEREVYDALALALLGRAGQAKARLEALPADDPTPWTQLVKAFCLERTGDAAGAKGIYDVVAQTEGPAGALAWAALGGLAAAADRVDEAVEAYGKAAAAGYPQAEVALALSRLYARSGDPSRALRLARLASHERPEDTEAQTVLGVAALRAGDTVLAAEALQKATRLSPNDPTVACAEGRLLYGEGRYADAAARFAAAGDAGETGAYAREARRRIDAAASRLVWHDGFDRPDSSVVQNRWQESERFGVEVSLGQGAARFVGAQKREAYGQTALTRDVESARFSGFRARLRVPAGSRARVGLLVRLRGREVRLYRGEAGLLLSSWKGAGRQSPEPVELARFDGEEHELSIEVTGEKRSDLVFRLDGREVGRARSRSLAERGAFFAAIFCEAPLGEPVDVTCQEASLFQTRD